MQSSNQGDEARFTEFRRKVQEGEVLSAEMCRVLADVKFTGRMSIVVQNGALLKAGYEEGYFTRRNDKRLL